MTSYRRFDFERTDRRRYVDAVTVPYAVPPGIVRTKCKGVLLGCQARISHLPTGRSIDCVTADTSGSSIGEASLAAAQFFNLSFQREMAMISQTIFMSSSPARQRLSEANSIS